MDNKSISNEPRKTKFDMQREKWTKIAQQLVSVAAGHDVSVYEFDQIAEIAKAIAHETKL